MPRWLQMTRSRLPRGTAIWAGLCVLLGLGLLTTLMDLAALPEAEVLQANAEGQRVIIDPVTGAVSGAGSSLEKAPFDVSHDDETPEETSAESAPEAVAEEVAKVEIDGPVLRTEAETTALPTIPSSRESIVAPPAPEITELGNQPLPKRGVKGAAASVLYAQLFQRQADMAYISFVITDAGFNAATLSQILKLPREVTVAMSPYALDPAPQITLLHTAGFETWGMLPAESARFPQDDPGPLGLLGAQDMKEQTKRLHSTMSATLGAVGLVLPPEETISDTDAFIPVLKEIDGRGLFLLSTHPQRRLSEITKDDALKKITRRADMVLDSTASAAFIQSKLASLPALAKEQKAVVVVASARPQTLSILAEWFKSKPLGSDVALAPLSAMYGPDAPPPLPEAPPAASSGHGGGQDAKPAEASGGHGGGH